MHTTIDKLSAFPLAPLFGAVFAGIVFFASPVVGRLLLSVWGFLIVCRLGPAWRLSDFFGGLIKKQKKKGGESWFR